MAKKETNRKPLAGNRRSHSCRATKHFQKLNLQVITLSDGSKRRVTAREKRAENKATA